MKHAGAGRSLREAQAPAILELGGDKRVIVFSLGSTSSGIPTEWSAQANRPGLYMIETQPEDPVHFLAQKIHVIKRRGDIIIVSVHWGSNWGYKIQSAEKRFAHRLVADAGVDVVHGHSSHHVKALEVFHERLILYGCGDFFNDYEGIGGYESFRGDLGLMYFADVNATLGKFLGLRMIPTQIRRFQLNVATPADCQWLEDRLNREGKRFNTRIDRSPERTFALRWS
ncbi:MAG: CapA family protein [Chloroflexota bacterium]